MFIREAWVIFFPCYKRLDFRIEGRMKIEVGDIIKLKKQHPCGSREWEVLRTGADFRLKCLGCSHQVMIKRTAVEKNIKEIKQKT